MGSSPFASPLPLSPALFRACFNKLLELRFYCFPNWSRFAVNFNSISTISANIVHLIFFDHLCVAYKGKTCRPACCVSFAFHEAEKESLAFPWEIFVAFATCCNSSCSGLVSLSALCLTVLYFGQSRRQLAVPQTVAGNPICVW